MFRTIRGKFVVGFFVIFGLSFVVLNVTLKEVIRTSNQKIITSDLIGLKNNGNVYVRQAFLINHFTNNNLYFGQMAEEMVDDLHRATSSEVAAYTVDGILLYASDEEAFAGRAADDLKQALLGKTAYTITYKGSTGSVYFAYPVVVDGVKVGILRYAEDFSPLYAQSGRILNVVFEVALAIFAAAFLFSYLLSRHITIPLTKLTRASTEVIGGNLNVRSGIRRKDEIGRLAANFNEMIGRISSQIATIGHDRDRLKQLNEQEKRFFDNVTHELKTPLTSILGYAEMIRENGTSDPAFFDKGMNHIVDESRRLHGMVLNLLEVSRRKADQGELEIVEAGAILRDVCDAMDIRAKRYKKRIVLAAADGLFVLGQGDRLRQLFINLLDNAIKYSSPRSEIAVLAAADPAAGIVRFEFANPGETLRPDELAAVFEPFYSGDRRYKEEGSVGLGLSIVKSIVDDHGGSIRIDAEAQRTIVRVELPSEGREAGSV
ncbi:HAMP domain-containing histidine kinase [Paenibacillus rhizovicinus]|uniref:histidine kinase n=1 Tax=Paenibacillus rhizovicinus TaxID=2704463 RepID=A0A6C0NUF5_9BACL|nr:HAMP domain-containing sensor histidine kinase [Paenibacillus rhizovicinus]QHW29556.1 HAMP domain-containing histidine kinase [Paenibacillus rhizovicinus]